MGFFSRIFGQSGVVRFECTTVEGDSFTGKMEVELFNIGTIELEDGIKNALFVEKGLRIESVTILGFLEK